MGEWVYPNKHQKIGPPHYSGGCLQQLLVFIAMKAMLPDLGA